MNGAGGELAERVRDAVLAAIYRKYGVRYVPVAISNRHAHLCREDVEALFGSGYALTPVKPLSQPGQFAAKETVTLVGPRGKIENVRVLGPERDKTQVEISVTDSYRLGINPVVRMSGDVAGSPGARLETPGGAVVLTCGVIVAARHLHISDSQAAEMGFFDGQVITLQTSGIRGAVLKNVVVRSGAEYRMEAHLDLDEANAAFLKNGDAMEAVTG
ncbi:MAG: phosphate propanoyltransferase [Synergistaceae bacterium]|jgi:putative phosphotransacetylase|nr:phosphate propanoyltransferase [Synergistaceae bacterium]